MAKTFLFLLFLSIGSFLFFAENGAVVILPDLEKPNDVKVDQECIYIIEAARVFIYSKNDFSLAICIVHRFNAKLVPNQYQSRIINKSYGEHTLEHFHKIDTVNTVELGYYL